MGRLGGLEVACLLRNPKLVCSNPEFDKLSGYENPSSFVDPTPLAHADASRDVLPRAGTSQYEQNMTREM
ncbi:hypothetical protein TNCV_4347121 [Trichonephila clavipes]|nr:hypothetical protein TNCV_4347121 [Trichonephila clavipes]